MRLTLRLCGVYKRKKTFLDSVRVFAKGGAGGAGIPKYGGTGGSGGSVLVQCDEKHSLIDLVKSNRPRRWIASPGSNSHKHCILGERGKDVVLKVPPGVSVLNDMGSEIADFNYHGERVVLVKGSPGGDQSNGFAGQKGVAKSFNLNLKLIADVGLVGFPNAGKSTLLKAISNAKPKIAGYPFTTIQPQIGILKYPDLRSISMADLPGLIEGAHINQGMGHSFLKHIERTHLLVFVVDVGGFKLSPRHTHRSAIEMILLLNRELELYRQDLINKPAILTINKMDTPGADEVFKEIVKSVEDIHATADMLPQELRPSQFIEFSDVIPMSAKTDPTSVQYVRDMIRGELDEHYLQEKEEGVKNQLMELNKEQQHIHLL